MATSAPVFAEETSVSISYSSVTNMGSIVAPALMHATFPAAPVAWPDTIVVIAHFMGYGGTAFDETYTNVRFGIGVDSATAFARSEIVSIPVLGSASCALTYVFSASAGAHTIYLLGEVTDASGPPITANADIVAWWVLPGAAG